MSAPEIVDGIPRRRVMSENSFSLLEPVKRASFDFLGARRLGRESGECGWNPLAERRVSSAICDVEDGVACVSLMDGIRVVGGVSRGKGEIGRKS